MVRKSEAEERVLTYLGHDHVHVSDDKGNLRLILGCKVMFAVSPEEYKILVEEGAVMVADGVRLVLPNVAEGEKK